MSKSYVGGFQKLSKTKNKEEEKIYNKSKHKKNKSKFEKNKEEQEFLVLEGQNLDEYS